MQHYTQIGKMGKLYTGIDLLTPVCRIFQHISIGMPGGLELLLHGSQRVNAAFV